MKTSNRILIIFCICIFLVPVSLFMAYSTMIRKGQYKLVSNIMADHNSGTFKPASVVKVIADGRDVICNIRQSDTLTYDYATPDRSDSVQVQNIGDTLLVRYINRKEDNRRVEEYVNQVIVNLKMPGVSNMIIDQGQINLLSMDTVHSQKLIADVSGSGILNLGGYVVDETQSVPPPALKLDQLIFESNNGNLKLGKGVHVRELTLQVAGKSQINLANGVRIDQVNGSISDSTSIVASWEALKSFQSLIIK